MLTDDTPIQSSYCIDNVIHKPQSVKVNDIQQYDETACAIANKWIVDSCTPNYNITPHDHAYVKGNKWKVYNYIQVVFYCL